MNAHQMLNLAAGIALTATFVGSFVLRETWLDYRYVRAMQLKNGRMRLAKRELGVEVARTIALVCYFIAALSSAAGAESEGPLSLERAIGIGAFGFGHLVLLIDSLRVLRYRLRESSKA